MPELRILSKHEDEYRRLIETANLRDLDILPAPGLDADILFGEPDLIRDALASFPALRWVQATWAGVEPLLDPALRRDYILTNARGVFGPLMSEFVFGYLLLHERKILQRLKAQKEHRWDPTLTGTLRGKTISLLGVGSIGAELAHTAKFFGMSVRGFTRSSESCPDVDEYFHADLPAFVSGVDYFVSVLPNTAETRHIIDTQVLNALPKHAIFINAGRGSAVDESALVKALETGAIAGAVLDVFEQEPLPAGHPLWSTPNTFITSHTSAPSFPGDIACLFIENYRLYVEGKPLRYVADFERGY
ncbi:MAG: D-2-hydroxyacid dehydrogenase [Anaerolineales bacterium]|nr:D-2-hydroxyacid dehydrogenase [Anaerolineales bacterium]